jgi:hypothetical protein
MKLNCPLAVQGKRGYPFNKIFLTYKLIQTGSGAKSYMRKDLLIFEELRKFLVIYEEGFPNK